MAVFKRTRADGSEYWQVKVRFNGRQISRNAATLKDGKRIERELLTAREQPIGPIDDPTIHELAAVWWQRHVEPHTAPATRETYATALKLRIIPHLGAERASSLTPALLNEWVAVIYRERPAPRATNHAIAVLRNMLSRSVEDGLIPANPAIYAKKVKETRRRIEIIEPDTVRELAEAAPLAAYPLIITLGFAGLRVGEALGLQWRDVRRDHLRIDRQLERRSGQDAPTKTSEQRTVPLLDPVREALAELERGKPTDRVFMEADGQPFTYDRLMKHYFRPARKELGMPTLRLHDLRHTFASLAISSGASAVQAARWLGHSDPNLTLSTYAHLFERDEAAIIERVNEAARGL
jgi:integrase